MKNKHKFLNYLIIAAMVFSMSTPLALGQVVTSMDPASGSVMGDTDVSILGSGFDPAATVNFGATPANVVYNSVDGDYLEVFSPYSATAGTVDVTVTNPASPPVSAGNFTYEALPGGEWAANHVLIDGNPDRDSSIESCQDPVTSSDGNFIVSWIKNNTDLGETGMMVQKIRPSDGTFLWPSEGGNKGGMQIDNSPSIECSGLTLLGDSTISDGNGGAYFLYSIVSSGQRTIFLQHVNSDGDILFDPPLDISASQPSPGTASYANMISDGQGGVYIVFRYFDDTANVGYFVLTRVNSSNSVVFDEIGPVDSNYPIRMVLDGNNNVYLSFKWDNTIHIYRYAPDGTRPAPWNNLITLPTAADEDVDSWAHRIFINSNNDLIVVYTSNILGTMYTSAQKILANGTTGQWFDSGTGGVKLMTDMPIYMIELISDGNDGVIVTGDRGDGTLRAQRINPDGTMQWGATGIPITDPALNNFSFDWYGADIRTNTLISDGSNGAIVTFTGPQGNYLQRISADGALLWPVGASDYNGINFFNDYTTGSDSPAAITGTGNADAALFWPASGSASYTDLYGQYYHVTAPPTVTNVTPNSGSDTGGTTVVITGTGFTGATDVEFGNLRGVYASCNILNVIDDDTIECETGAHEAGLVGVQVTTPAGTGTGHELYQYLAGYTPPTNDTIEIHNFVSSEPDNFVAGISNGNDAGGLADIDFTDTPTSAELNSAESYAFSSGIPTRSIIAQDIEDDSWERVLEQDGGGALDNEDDAYSTIIPLGFDITIYGREVNAVRITSNGFVYLNNLANSFGTDVAATVGYSMSDYTHLPSSVNGTATGDILIAGAWGRIDTTKTADDRIWYYSDAANQKFVIYFYGMEHPVGLGPITSQIKILGNGVSGDSGGGSGSCSGGGPGYQCGILELSCSSTSPSFTVTPAASFAFYPNGSSGTIYSSLSEQTAFNNPSGSPLTVTSGNDYLEVNDVRDPSLEGCNEGLSLVLHAINPGYDILDPGKDQRYFDSNDGNATGNSIPLTGTYVLSNTDTCPAGYTERGGDVCFKDGDSCGNTDGNQAITCNDTHGITTANYDGNVFADIGSYSVALGSAADTPSDVTVLSFSDNAELYGHAGIGVSYGMVIPSGQPNGTYALNLEYVLTGA
jgi:hypothetical protein